MGYFDNLGEFQQRLTVRFSKRFYAEGGRGLGIAFDKSQHTPSSSRGRQGCLEKSLIAVIIPFCIVSV